MHERWPELERGQSAQVTKRKHIPTWLFKMADNLDYLYHKLSNVIENINLIGMKKDYDSIWKVKRYGTNTVIDDTLKHMSDEGLHVAVGEKYYDIDDRYDLKQLYDDIKKDVVDNCPNTKAYLVNVLREKMENVNEDL
jgi:hypothetical protein